MKTFITTSALVAAMAFGANANAGGTAVSYKAPAATYKTEYKAPVVETVKIEAPVVETVEVVEVQPIVTHAAEGNYVAAPAGLNVTLGGFADFQAGFLDTDTHTGSDVKFRNDTEIHVRAEGVTESGLVYGAAIELEADVSLDSNGNSDINADKTYLYVEGNSGRWEMGNVDGAQDRLAVGGAVISAATGGIAGDWHSFVPAFSDTGNALTNGILVAPGSISAALGNSEADSTKLSYYTPDLGGLTFGVSYTPEDDAAGQNVGGNVAGQEELWGLGLNYALDLDGVGFEFSAGYELGSADTAGNPDRDAYNVGLGLNFGSFQIAGSYGDLGEALATNDDVTYVEVAAAYNTGEFGLSVGYLATEYNANELEVISLGADYELAPGFVPYVEVNFFDAEDGTAVLSGTNQDGTVVLAGVQLNF